MASTLNLAATPREALANLPEIVKTLLMAGRNGDRAWQIVQRRFRLAGAPELTLEQLGAAFQLSRERVRQLEERALATLSTVVLSASPSGFAVPPHIPPALCGIVAHIDSESAQAIREDVLLDRLGCDQSDHVIIGSLTLLCRLAGIQRLSFQRSPLPPVLVRGDKSRAAAIQRTVLRLHSLLSSNRSFILPQEDLDVLVNLNHGRRKSEQLTLAELRAFVPLCGMLERTEDGHVQALFHHIEGRGNQALRLLAESGGPMDGDDIARQINALTVPYGNPRLYSRNLVNQLIADGRFVPLGKSGFWDVKSRLASRAQSIVHLMEEYLVRRDAGATKDDIYTAVSSQRPVARSSINTYLNVPGGRFAQVSRGVWGLAFWPEAKKAHIWSEEQVSSWIIQTFRGRRTQQMDFSELKRLFMAASGLSSRQASGLLGRSGAITTELVRWDKRLATLVRDYEPALRGVPRPRVRTRKTLLDQVAQRSREILEIRPDHEISLAELIASLMSEFRRPKHTLYNYVSRLGFVETFTRPEIGQRRCRLKVAEDWSTRVRKIQSSVHRGKALRALKRLNEDEVDIALFLLSKELEATLGAFLRQALHSGTLQKPPALDPGKWRLNDMVRIAADNGFISDRSVMNLLREERNERAHGTMPSAEERSIMMQIAPTHASMYVDYIAFFANRLLPEAQSPSPL